MTMWKKSTPFWVSARCCSSIRRSGTLCDTPTVAHRVCSVPAAPRRGFANVKCPLFTHTHTQGAGQGGFVQLCEAIVSWRHLPCEGLRNNLVQLMQASWRADSWSVLVRAHARAHPALPATLAEQGYKHQLDSIGQWQAAMANLSPAAQQKLQQMCQV